MTSADWTASLGGWLSLLSAFAVGLAGCGAAAPPPPDPPTPETHIRALWHLQREYVSSAGSLPSSAEALKTWAQANLTPDRLRLLGINNVEETFVSRRDGLPYVLRQVVSKAPLVIPQGKQDDLPAAPIMIHESKGVNGKRLVVLVTGYTTELPEDAFQRALRTK